MPNITVNGEQQPLHNTNTTLNELVTHFKLSPEHVVVDCNGTVYKGTDSQYIIQENDTIEIVHFVGGGS